MNRSQAAAALKRGALAAGILSAVLRILLLYTAFDDNGLLPAGSYALRVTVLTALCFFVGLLFLALRLNRLPGTEACLAPEGPLGWVALGAAGLLFAGSMVLLLDPAGEASMVWGAWWGLAAALCMAGTVLEGISLWAGLSAVGLLLAGSLTVLLKVDPQDRALLWAARGSLVAALALGAAMLGSREKRVFWLRLPPALFATLSLILRFRSWSQDPLVIHVAPSLLAWVCVMVELVLLPGFALNAGHRRSGVLFGLAAGVYTLGLLPDLLLTGRGSASELLSVLGLGCWCVVPALALLRDLVQQEEPAPEPVETMETKNEEFR